MATITIDGTVHKGKTPESIARREWGRKAEVIYSADPCNKWGDSQQITIVRKDKYGTHVLAVAVAER